MAGVRRLLLLVGAIVFVDTVFFAALTPLLPHYADRLDLSKAQAGVLAGMYPAGSLVAAIPGGVVTTRLGVKRTLLIGLAMLAATTLVFGFASTYWALNVARFVQGVSSSFSWTAAFAWLLAATSPARRGEVIGKAMGAAIGGALFGPVVGVIASVAGTGPTFAAVGVLAAGLGAAAVATPAFAPGAGQPVGELWRARRDPLIVAGTWFVLLPALGFSLVGVLAPLHLARLGFGTAAISAVFLLSAALETVITPLGGALSDRRGHAFPLRLALVAATLTFLLLAWADERWAIAALVVATAIGLGTFWAPSMAMLADAAEARGLDHAYGFALVNLAWAPGATAGTVIGGAIAGAVADAVPYVAVAALCALSLGLVTLGPRGRARASTRPLALDGESS
jgi:MFS family permease